MKFPLGREIPQTQFLQRHTHYSEYRIMKLTELLCQLMHCWNEMRLKGWDRLNMNAFPKTVFLKESILNLECSILIQNANLNTTKTPTKQVKLNVTQN